MIHLNLSLPLKLALILHPRHKRTSAGPRIRSQHTRRMVKGPYTFEQPEDLIAVNQDDIFPNERRPLVSNNLNLGVRSVPKTRVSKTGESAAKKMYSHKFNNLWCGMRKLLFAGGLTCQPRGKRLQTQQRKLRGRHSSETCFTSTVVIFLYFQHSCYLRVNSPQSIPV